MAQFSDSMPIANPSSIYASIAADLTIKDWEKIIFLSNQYIDINDEARILGSVQTTLNQNLASGCTPEYNLKQLVFAIRTHYQAKHQLQLKDSDNLNILQELLYIIKKYRLLKLLNACHHKLSVEERKYIPHLWVYLFTVVEELVDDQIAYIASQFSYSINESRRGFLLAKDLFHYLYTCKVITDTSVDSLKPVLQGYLKRNDLYKKALEFEKKMVSKYKITAATLGRPCGLAVIFNHFKFDKIPPKDVFNRTDLEERVGTHRDCARLKNLWEYFGMKTIVHNDLTSVELLTEIHNLNMMDFSNYEIFVCCVLSHGEKGFIFGSDGVKVPIADFYWPFGEGVRSLKGPKLFFFQACQGEANNPLLSDAVRENNGNQTPRPRPSAPLTTSISLVESPPRPLYADMLVGKSTVPGFKSWRSEKTGAVYIEKLVDILLEKGENHEFLDLLTEVNRAVSEKIINGVSCQMPTITTQLTRKLFLKKALYS